MKMDFHACVTPFDSGILVSLIKDDKSSLRGNGKKETTRVSETKGAEAKLEFSGFRRRWGGEGWLFELGSSVATLAGREKERDREKAEERAKRRKRGRATKREGNKRTRAGYR